MTIRPWLFALLACLSCKQAPDPGRGLLNRGTLRIVDGSFEGDLVRRVASARQRAWLVVEELPSTALATAMLRALDRGVDVRVAADWDHPTDPGIAALQAGLAQRKQTARLTLVGKAITYSPEPARTLVRSSAIDRLTHHFLLVDSAEVITWSAPLTQAAQGLWVFDTSSTDLAKDFEDEAAQLLDGVDATTLSFFDGPLKSNSNQRVSYPMPEGVWELYFGPQERLMKRVIDEVYAARTSIRIMTPALENSFLTSALRYKARVGKRVEVIVDERWFAKGEAARARLGTDGAQPGDRAQVAALDRLLALKGELTLLKGRDIAATVIVVDSLKAPNGKAYTTRVAVVSHPLPESIPFVTGDLSVESDAFMDGHMWILQQLPGRVDPDARRAIVAQQRVFTEGVAP